ncbi:MAG: helix-turn-helix domain-containing protein [Methyloligellaceae bacterium]
MSKGQNLQKIWDKLPEKRRQKINKRAIELKQQYLTLQELRSDLGLTQSMLSEKLDVPQSNLSRLENSTDMRISTLRQYIEAMGGELELTVKLPGKEPVTLSGLDDLIESTGN